MKGGQFVLTMAFCFWLGQGSAQTGDIRGVNWADPHDNYSDTVVVPSGLSTSLDYAAVSRKADLLLTAFADRGANTVRLPVNPYTVAGPWWKNYSGAIDAALAHGFKVILAYWEGTAVKDGRVDDTTAFWRMWQTVTSQYASKDKVFFEVFNEPFGYKLDELKDLYVSWLGRFALPGGASLPGGSFGGSLPGGASSGAVSSLGRSSSVPRGRVLLDGLKYAENVDVIGADHRFDGCLLSYHVYTWFAKQRKTVADWEGAISSLAYPERTILTEFGMPMSTGRDFLDPAATDPSVTYLQGLTAQLRARGMGSVYWPGLRTGDIFSLVDLTGTTVTTNNVSGLDRVRYGWGLSDRAGSSAGSGTAGLGSVDAVGSVRHSFALGDSTFLLDDKPFLMISGEIHYARVPREAWRQRMRMAKAMGLNTIGTYVFWNLAEPEKGRFDFSGNNDIAAFVRTAQEEGLWVILRPSPYVCAEWEYGGYPYWLQNEKDLVVRSTNETYLRDYTEYIDQVGRQLSPLLVTHGGNILMVQIENEYGSYGHDSTYLAVNKKIFQEAGFDGLLYTCDPPKDVVHGHVPGLLPAVNGSPTPAEVRSVVNRFHHHRGPYYVAEWYPAWFDWWGEPHHTVPPEKYAVQLDSLLSNGISINMYMFHGGTTRGFMNGANNYDTAYFQPQVSSYDYDAPLDEAGNATAKFMAFRKVIASHLPAGVVLPEVPGRRAVVETPVVKFDKKIGVFDLAGRPVVAERPLSFEDLHQAYGYVLYRTTVVGGGSGLLRIDGLRDYAILFVNGRRVGVLERRLKQDSLLVRLPAGKVRLDILIENQGRVNFGPYLLKNNKGIIGGVSFAGRELKNWEMYGLPMDTIKSEWFSTAGVATGGSVAAGAVPGGSRMAAGPVAAADAGVPVLRRGSFVLDKIGDTWLDMRRWGKGVVWVNGHNLGRYWEIGPQQTVYVPAEWLKKGRNELVIFEMLKPGQTVLKGIDHPILDELK